MKKSWPCKATVTSYSCLTKELDCKLTITKVPKEGLLGSIKSSFVARTR